MVIDFLAIPDFFQAFRGYVTKNLIMLPVMAAQYNLASGQNSDRRKGQGAAANQAVQYRMQKELLKGEPLSFQDPIVIN